MNERTALMKSLRSARSYSAIVTSVGLAVIGAVALLTGDSYLFTIGSFVAIYALLCLGLVLLFGFSGQISVAQAGFYGIGAYATALSTTELGWHPLLGMCLGAAIAAGIATLVGWPILRLRHFYLALATLAIGAMARVFFNEARGLTNGPLGIYDIPSMSILGVNLGSPLGSFGVASFFLIGSLVFAERLGRSRIGNALHALRSSEAAASVIGIDVRLVKTQVFVLSAVLAAIAGGIFAVFIRFISPDSFTVHFAIGILVAIYIGGLRYIGGAVIGAIVLATLPEFLRRYGDIDVLVYGVILVLVVMFFSDGVAGVVSRLLSRLRQIRRRYSSGNEKSVSPAESGSEEATRPDDPVSFKFAHVGRLATDESVGSPPANTVALEVRNVSHRFGGLDALTNVAFNVEEGEICALIGPNGAGKTTLFNLISGLLEVQAGTVHRGGTDITALRPHRLGSVGVGRTFQSLDLFTDQTVYRNIRVGGYRIGSCGFIRSGLGTRTSRRQETSIDTRTLEVVSALGLEDVAYRVVADLPFATQRLVDLGRALMAYPTLLLMDEPASGLSVGEVAALKGLLGQLRDAGQTVLVVEHNVEFVLSTADHVIVLDQGNVIFDGDPGGVGDSGAVRAAYLGASHSAPETPVE